MPLYRQLFELRISPEGERTMRRAYHFLAENREMAYSLEDLAGELGAPAELEVALLALGRIMAIESREIRGVEYFAWLQEFDTGTWLSIRHSKV